MEFTVEKLPVTSLLQVYWLTSAMHSYSAGAPNNGHSLVA